jgi:hypothetical protein
VTKKLIDRKKESGSSVREALEPCPLCGSTDLDDRGYGISCRQCGIWFSDSTRFSREGLTFREVWNRRKKPTRKGECVECHYLGSAPEEVRRAISNKCRDCSDDTHSNFLRRKD